MTSAVRVDGERLYRKAHRGEEVERPAREVEILRAELLADDGEAGTATFEIECSSGTYIRTLIESLGDAYCLELRRTAIGPLRIERRLRRCPSGRGAASVPARDRARRRAGAAGPQRESGSRRR